MVLEARRIVHDESSMIQPNVIEQLNHFDYPKAAIYVYGMNINDWKQKYQAKATDEQMERYQSSKHLWAKHDEQLLSPAPQGSTPPVTTPVAAISRQNTKSLASNVCCEPISDMSIQPNQQQQSTDARRDIKPFVPPMIPKTAQTASLRIYILTISDRAFRNEYETGDLSGPAVQDAVCQLLETSETKIVIVPDDKNAIQDQLTAWCDQKESPHIVLTTGGTGLGPRDVTPEATRNILDQECSGLMSFATTECSRQQPLASLSRGTAGIRKKTMVANLPGNPKAANEILSILLPLLIQGITV